MLEINAGGKRIMTVTDDNKTVVHDRNVAKEIQDNMVDGLVAQMVIDENLTPEQKKEAEDCKDSLRTLKD